MNQFTPPTTNVYFHMHTRLLVPDNASRPKNPKHTGPTMPHASPNTGRAIITLIRVGHDDDDMLELLKLKARIAHEFATEARASGLYWDCDVCGASDNLLWYKCLGCGAPYPESAIAMAKADARRVLSHAQTLGEAQKDNPYREGVMSGYGLGRYSAVAGEGLSAHPAAFEPVALMPPPPPCEECSLPDTRMLGIVLTEGAAEWPEVD